MSSAVHRSVRPVLWVKQGRGSQPICRPRASFRWSVLLGCVLAMALACTSAATKHRDTIQQLDLEMSKAEVLGVMGPPDRREAYLTTDGGHLEVLFYVTESQGKVMGRAMQGDTREPEATPVVLLNGKLIGWGAAFWETEKPVYVNVHVH